MHRTNQEKSFFYLAQAETCNFSAVDVVIIPVPEFIDPVFAKTSPKCSFSVIENERFGLVFAKTGSIIRTREGAD